MRRDKARSEMMQQLEQLQGELRDNWIEDSLPADWQGMDYWFPAERPATRVTIRLDADMVRWFRKELGQGYGKRMNLILRIWWTALLGGTIKAHPHDDNLPRLMSAARRTMDDFEQAYPDSKG